MSDDEINRLIVEVTRKPKEPQCKILRGSWWGSYGHLSTEMKSRGHFHDGRWWVEFPNYLRSITASWPLMISSKITLIDLHDEYMAVGGLEIYDDEFNDNIAGWEFESRSKNPLRAVGVVFLMMRQ